MIEPFPSEDVETSAANLNPVSIRTPGGGERGDEPRPLVYPNEKSAFRRPGGLPSHPRVGGGANYNTGYIPPYPYSSSGSESSESQSRRESSWREGSGTAGTGYGHGGADDDRGNANFSPTTTDPSSGTTGVSRISSGSSGGRRTYVSPYEGGRRTGASGSAPLPPLPSSHRRRGNNESMSTTREADVLATLTEVAELRREVERIRMVQEQGGGGPDSSESEFGASVMGMPPPPSYEDEVVQRRRAPPLVQVPSSISSGLADAELTPVRSQK